MEDMHVHLERVEYTFEWIDKFVNQAVKMGIDTMCFVEHTHQFKEFAPMYKDIAEYSSFQHEWYGRKVLSHIVTICHTKHTCDKVYNRLTSSREI